MSTIVFCDCFSEELKARTTFLQNAVGAIQGSYFAEQRKLGPPFQAAQFDITDEVIELLWIELVWLGDCPMDTSIIPALAGLTGAAIGGLTSGIASWVAQKTQSRVHLLAQDKVLRQELYKEFIEIATQCYADALQHEKPDIPALVNLYGKIGRMRVLSSPKVLASAEQIGQKIMNIYLEPSKTFAELREMINKNTIDILGGFGEACREEFRSLRI
jgi:hypothetical protein